MFKTLENLEYPKHPFADVSPEEILTFLKEKSPDHVFSMYNRRDCLFGQYFNSFFEASEDRVAKVGLFIMLLEEDDSETRFEMLPWTIDMQGEITKFIDNDQDLITAGEIIPIIERFVKEGVSNTLDDLDDENASSSITASDIIRELNIFLKESETEDV